jgi:hypothetical protein
MKNYTFDELWNRLPEQIRTGMANCEQNPKYHPEGNCDVHIRLVFDYAKENYPEDTELLICAIFHDLGKLDTFKIHPKKGVPTAYGHERYAKRYLDKYFHLYSDISTNKEKIEEICENHMKAHLYKDGRLSNPNKRKAFEDLKYFNDIINFSKCDANGKK